MLGKTHKAFGVATMSGMGLAYQQLTQQSLPQPFLSQPDDQFGFAGLFVATVLLIGSLMGASYPDIDQELPIKHRGATHTLWGVGIVVAVTIWAHIAQPMGSIWTAKFLLPLLVGFTVGYLSHLVADAFSTAGIAWFYPLQQYKSYGNGAEVVKGNRFIFQPIYKVGQKFFGIPGHIIWWTIATIMTALWVLTIY